MVGVLCAVVVFGAGRLLERAILGRDDLAARTRVEAEVRQELDTMSRRLRDLAAGAADAQLLPAASEGNPAAARRLFDASAAALTRGNEGELALTTYAADGMPLAWAGRPSEIPPDRVAGNEAWFITPGALGLRLVYVTPVTQDGNRRVGSTVAESAIGTSFPTRIAPVSIDLPFEGELTTPNATAFEVTAPSGQRLLTARVDAAELARARDWWRRATLSLTLVAIALTLVAMVGPLLDWRNGVARRFATRRSQYAAAALLTGLVIVAARVVLLLASPADWSSAP